MSLFQSTLCRCICLAALLLLALPDYRVAHADGSSTNNSLPEVFEDKPVWEYGVGAASVQVPAYPSSAASQMRSLVLPYAIYRGRTVRVQGGGLKAVAVENSRVSVDVSIGGSLNADSSESELRAGMPDLDYLFEIGPRIEVRLHDRLSADGGRSRLAWSTQLRAVFSTDFSSIDGQGAVFGSQLNYRRDGWLHPKLSLLATGGPVWGSERALDYFFEVDEQFVTANRPAFDGRGGYLGFDVNVGFMFKYRPDLRFVAGLGSSLHGGSANRDSPLFERETTTGFAVAILWQIGRSKETVRVIDN